MSRKAVWIPRLLRQLRLGPAEMILQEAYLRWEDRRFNGEAS